jgi:hypothetical protein
MSWRDEPMTEKQRQYIADMMEFSDFPLPKFTGTTQGEACAYIGEYTLKAHESFMDIEVPAPYEGETDGKER